MIRRRCWFCEQEMPETVMTLFEATGNWFCASSKACDDRWKRLVDGRWKAPSAGSGTAETRIGDGT